MAWILVQTVECVITKQLLNHIHDYHFENPHWTTQKEGHSSPRDGQKETGQNKAGQKETRQKETRQKVLHLGQKVLFKKFLMCAK